MTLRKAGVLVVLLVSFFTIRTLRNLDVVTFSEASVLVILVDSPTTPMLPRLRDLTSALLLTRANVKRVMSVALLIKVHLTKVSPENAKKVEEMNAMRLRKESATKKTVAFHMVMRRLE